MAKNILKAEKNPDISPDFDKKTESKTSSTFDIKHKSLIQFVGTEKKITPFELKMVENYIIKAVFAKYKLDIKKFETFMEGLLKVLKDSISKPDSEVPKPIELEVIIEDYIFKNLYFLKKEAITDAVRKNGFLSFLMIIVQNRLQRENLQESFLGKRIRYNQKIIYCSNERHGCAYKGKFSDFLTHERDECQFEKICCPFMNCKAKELRKDMKAHEKVCPFKDNPRTENKDLSILLHIDESKLNFTEHRKKDDDLNSSSESLDSPIFSWLMMLFNRIKYKFKLHKTQVIDLQIKKKSVKFSNLKSHLIVTRLLYFLLIFIFFDSAVSTFFFLSLLLKIGSDASHIQGANLAYLIATSFILLLDVLIALITILLSFLLFLKHLDGLVVSFRTLFCFGICRVVASIILFANYQIFQDSQTCKDIEDLCYMNDLTQIDHYVSFAVQILATITLFLVYCKF